MEKRGLQKAAAHFEMKSASSEMREISGLMTTPTPDRIGDVVNPMGGRWALPIPLLLGHSHTAPVGLVEYAKAGKNGVEFRARIKTISEPGTLKDRTDEAWQSVKEGLITSVSIGFRVLRQTPMQGGSYVFDEWELLELSLVVVPANPQALIQSRRSIDLVGATSSPVRVVRLKHPKGVVRLTPQEAPWLRRKG